MFELKWMDRYWHFHIYLVLTDVEGFYFNACLKMKKFLYSMRNLTIISAKVVRQSSLMHCTLRVHDTSSPITSLCLKLHLQSLPSHFLTLRPATEFRTSKTRCTHTRSLNTHGQLSQGLGTLPYLYIERKGVKGLLVSYMLFLECNISNFYF